MQSGLKLSLGAMLISSALSGCASTQTSDQTAVNTAPGAVNEGTLAESANTTALATSTYHQPSGFLPGMKP
jgi:outer membrane murein-binding lipoprotein Lpp